MREEIGRRIIDLGWLQAKEQTTTNNKNPEDSTRNIN
jgi:hypothetical protein